jgi:hypothetical protein
MSPELLRFLFRELIAVYFGTHMKYVSTFCVHGVELWNVNKGGKYSNHSFKGAGIA